MAFGLAEGLGATEGDCGGLPGDCGGLECTGLAGIAGGEAEPLLSDAGLAGSDPGLAGGDCGLAGADPGLPGGDSRGLLGADEGLPGCAVERLSCCEAGLPGCDPGLLGLPGALSTAELALATGLPPGVDISFAWSAEPGEDALLALLELACWLPLKLV